MLMTRICDLECEEAESVYSSSGICLWSIFLPHVSIYARVSVYQGDGGLGGVLVMRQGGVREQVQMDLKLEMNMMPAWMTVSRCSVR